MINKQRFQQSELSFHHVEIIPGAMELQHDLLMTIESVRSEA